MRKNIFQIVYDFDRNDPTKINPYFKEEALVMKKKGILVDVKPLSKATKLMYRGFTMNNEQEYPTDERYINTAKQYFNYLRLSEYYSSIEDISIETFFAEELNDSIIVEMEKRKWEKAFIKKDTIALEHIGEGKSVFPKTSLREMLDLYNKLKVEGVYCIRKYINPKFFLKEERYWVFNGTVYHRSNIVPSIVLDAVNRLNEMGSKYYAIDATSEFIVEVNPGESSDRHAVNTLDIFSKWINDEFNNGSR